MRISDWSSDVCSSDLPREPGRDIMFGEIDVIMRRDDRDLRPLAAFGPVNALARMPARLNARRGRRYAADELRVEAFDARSEERRVGKGWVSTCGLRWSPEN